ncbi:MAG: YihY/virulence factor BrkB family protein [Ktedonobacteraceae bacterium]
MPTQIKESSKQTEPKNTPEAKQAAAKNIKILPAFWTKISNDWVMTFAAGLAFNLITAIFPIVIAIIAIAGFVFNSFDSSFQAHLITSIDNAFPPPLNQSNIVGPALTTLSKNANFLLIFAVIFAIFGGSRLFITIEGYFAIIYHTRQRTFIKQNVMALSMLLLFVILVPLMVFVSSIPAIIQSMLNFPGNDVTSSLIAILLAFLFAWILFEAIYIVVPNQRIKFRNSLPGAIVAGVALEVYLLVFPLYVTHFLGNDKGQIGFVVILLFFFYYFAVILLLGAEINVFFAEGIRTTPDNLPAMVHHLTNHLPVSKEAIQEQAPLSHKNQVPEDTLPKSEANKLENQASGTELSQEEKDAQPASSNHTDHTQHHTQHHTQKDKHKSYSPGTSNVFILIEVLAGTALAFALQFFNIKRKK